MKAGLANSSDRPRGRWPACIALGAIWLPVLNHLRQEWSVNEQYSYGFVVPLLAAYLFALRWADRPASSRPWASRGVEFVFVGCAILMFPLILAGGANSDWRFLGWTMTALAIGATMVLLGGAGGWRWVRHFAFPVLFILVAVPWPMRFETAMIGWMMEASAGIAAEVLNLLAIPARPSGNLIELESAVVGVDEACSGVRSLQTMLMTGLFLGELPRMSKPGRFLMVAGACVLAGAWNLGRTLTLVALTLKGGPVLMTDWHDRVGWGFLALSLGSVFVLAHLMRSVTPVSQLPESSVFRHQSRIPALFPRVSYVVIGWIAFSLVASEAWYLSTSGNPNAAPAWTITWPDELPGMHEVPIPQQTWRLMKFTTGVNRVWSDETGRRWSAFHLEWAPSRAAQALARMHSPEICLASTGLRLVEEGSHRTFRVNGVEIPFRRYLFDDAGSPLHVYFSLRSAGVSGREMDEVEELTWRSRMAAIWERRRNAGQRQLELAVWDCRDESEAADAMQRLLERLILPREVGGE